MRSSRELSAVSGHGVGLVWWAGLDPLCRPSEGLVQVIEVEPETFWMPRDVKSSRFTSRLGTALAHLPQPKLLHGVGAPFGGTVTQSTSHRETLAGDIAALQPDWISDHLNFNQFTPSRVGQAVCTGFFLPPAQCPDGVAIAVEQIRHRSATTGRPVAFEVPVSYLPMRPNEMPDGAFAAAVAESADCGILLDLHNLLCNERNGRQTVAAFCDSIPLDRVWEIHVAGGKAEGEYWLDSHSDLMEPALMEILTEIVPRLPRLGAIIFELGHDYIDSIGLPPIAKMLGELNDVWATNGRSAAPVQHPLTFRHTPHRTDAMTSAMWERALGAFITGGVANNLPPELAEWAGRVDAPLGLYRNLASETRASSLLDAAPRTVHTLLRCLGEARTRDVLARFWRHATPAYTIVEDAWSFLDFVARAGLPVPDLDADIEGDRSFLNQFVMTAQ